MSEPSKLDTKEFLSLLTRHDQATFSYILALVPNWADAEEIAQEVRMRLWEQYETKFQPGTDFGAWARSVAHYLVLTFRQKSSKRHTGFSREFLESIAAEAEETSPALDARMAALDDCMKKLDGRQREILESHYRGKTLRAVAEAMGASLDAVRKSVYRARLSLASCIERTLRRGGDE